MHRSLWLVCLSLCLLSPLRLSAAVTYAGTDGVLAKVFNANSQRRCLDCHSSSLTGSARNGATTEVNYDTYAWAAWIPSPHNGAAAYVNARRAKVRVLPADPVTNPGGGGMPPTAVLTTAEQTLLSSWVDANYPQNAAPVVKTVLAPGHVTDNSAWLGAQVQENGIDTLFEFQYGTAPGTYTTTSAATTPTGSGGGGDDKSLVLSQLNLSCGTTYYFRARSRANSSYPIQNGTELNFTTLACPSFSSQPVTALNEDTAYSYDADAVDSQAHPLTYTLVVAPGGMTIDASSGQVNWTPPLNYTTATNVSIKACDGGPNKGACGTQTFVINITAVNDPPTITSLSNQTINEDSSGGPLSITITDAESQGTLTLSGHSSNPALISDDHIHVDKSATDNKLANVSFNPLANQSGVATITITVSDGALTASSSFILTVTPVNDPPTMLAIDDKIVTELDTLSVQTNVTDPDDANDGSGALVYSLSNAPTGMSINNTGFISWTPGKNTAGIYSVTVQVADGGENSVIPAVRNMKVTVNKQDSDNDSVADYDDNCPAFSNPEQLDFDGDGQGDGCDLDTDDDGIPDAVEVDSANGLNPKLLGDARLDKDQDGYINVAEYRAGTEMSNGSLTPDPTFRRRYDLNRDYSADLVLRNRSSNDVQVWLTRSWGKILKKVTVTQETVLNQDWQIVGINDIDGDTRSDLVWRNNVTGENRIWLMDAEAIHDTKNLESWVDSNWQIVAVADFDGDGKAELLWHNHSTRASQIWALDASQQVSKKVDLPVSPSPNAVIVGADFTRSGKTADIIWYNAVTGAVSVWTMEADAVKDMGVIGAIADLAWHIEGIGNLDGDNNDIAELVWRNTGTGAQRVWRLNGTVSPIKLALPPMANVNADIVWIGDADGNGKADLLFRDRSNDKLILWLMDTAYKVVRRPYLGVVKDFDILR